MNQGQTHLTGETILKKPNDFNSNINTSISNSLSNSNNNNNNTNSNNNTKEQISININNIKKTSTPTISQSSSVIYQPLTKIEGFSSANSLSSKKVGGEKWPPIGFKISFRCS